MCAEHVRSGALVRVATDWTAGEIATSLIMPSRRGLLPSVRIVADLIVEQLRKLLVKISSGNMLAFKKRLQGFELTGEMI